MIKKILPLLISANSAAASCLDRSVSELLPIDKNALYKVNQVIVSAPKRSYLYSFPDPMCKMNGVFLDKNGKSQHYEMGCYGIGVTRTVQAAIEQSHDQDGIIWPKSISPVAGRKWMRVAV